MIKIFYHALISIITITYIIFVLLTLNIDTNLASLSSWADMTHNFSFARLVVLAEVEVNSASLLPRL